MAQEQKESIDRTFDQFMQPDLGFRTGVILFKYSVVIFYNYLPLRYDIIIYKKYRREIGLNRDHNKYDFITLKYR